MYQTPISVRLYRFKPVLSELKTHIIVLHPEGEIDWNGPVCEHVEQRVEKLFPGWDLVQWSPAEPDETDARSFFRGGEL